MFHVALRRLIDASLDEPDVDRTFLKACGDVLHERLERLQMLEEASSVRRHHERSLP